MNENNEENYTHIQIHSYSKPSDWSFCTFLLRSSWISLFKRTAEISKDHMKCILFVSEFMNLFLQNSKKQSHTEYCSLGSLWTD